MPTLDQISDIGAFTSQDAIAINSNFQALGAGIPTQGNVYYVRPKNGYNGNDGKSPAKAFRTLAYALAVAKANQNDIVYLLAESNTAADTTDYQSATLDWNKDGVHLIGVNCGVAIGSRSRVALALGYAVASNLFTLSANNCLIKGIELFAGVASALPTGCMKVTGQCNHVVNCQISGIGNAANDILGAYDLTVTGNENQFDDCYVGLDTLIRATCVTGTILSGTPTRTIFQRCRFEYYTSASTFKGITVPIGADRFVRFIDCDFVATQNITSAVAPTGLIGITTMNGQVLMRNPYLYGFANYVTGDNAYVQILGHNGLATGHLIGIAQGVDVT